jgi:hypothetical protein
MVWPTLGRFRTDRYGIARARNGQNVHVGHDCTPNVLNVQYLHARHTSWTAGSGSNRVLAHRRAELARQHRAYR